MMFIIVWALLATAGCVALFLRGKNRWKTADRLMDDILSDRDIDVSEMDEGELSLFVNRLRRIQDKLQNEIGHAADEKEQVKQLISNMSHQLKTPIANVMMYTQLLENEELPPEQKALFLGKLREYSERINWILNSLFKMTKLEQNVIAFEAGYGSIQETIRQAVSAVYETAEAKNIKIVMQEFPDMNLYHNRRWTVEAFENILENAVKYTDTGGMVTISAETFEMYAGIVIKDSGMGIPEEEQSHIFHRFYRGTQVQDMEGSGIGLYFTKIILEKEKGYITVSSEYGKGSRFSVFFRKE